jgi:hypothetical protein
LRRFCLCYEVGNYHNFAVRNRFVHDILELHTVKLIHAFVCILVVHYLVN